MGPLTQWNRPFFLQFTGILEDGHKSGAGNRREFISKEMKLIIAKIAKSRRVADQVEALAERRGDGFKELSGGALN